MARKSKAKNLLEPKTKGLPLNEAIGIFERAFRKVAPELVERELREMLNVQIIVIQDKKDFEQRIILGNSFPPQITVPFGVFLNKIRGEEASIYRIDLQMLKEMQKGRIQQAEGVFYSPELLIECSDWELRPGQTYVVLSSGAGYWAETGLTFEGEGEIPEWIEPGTKSNEPLETSSRYQSLAEHLQKTYQKARSILALYEPFIKNWVNRIFPEVESDKRNQIYSSLIEGISIAALFHDVGKLSNPWQEAAGWKNGDEFIGRTKRERRDEREFFPKHAPYAYPFIRMLLRKYFEVEEPGEGRILDHIALASAKHHNIEVMGDIKADEFQSADEEKAIEVLKNLARDVHGENLMKYVDDAYQAMKGECKADEPPGPSEDFYFLYCIAHRTIKMADWEDAGEEILELREVRQQ